MGEPDRYQQFPADDERSASTLLRLFVIGGVSTLLLLVSCVVAGIVMGRSSDDEKGKHEAPSLYTLRLANRIPGVPAVYLNHLAWEAATDPQVSKDVLAEAEVAAKKATVAEPKSSAYADTLATVYYRQARHDLAVETEETALRLEYRVVIVSQLARFQLAQTLARGARTVGTPLVKTPALRLRPIDPSSGAAWLDVDVLAVPSHGMTVHGVVVDAGGAPVAHIMAWIPGDAPIMHGSVTAYPGTAAFQSVAPAGSDLRIVTTFVDTTRPVDKPTPNYAIVLMDPAIAALP